MKQPLSMLHCALACACLAPALAKSPLATLEFRPKAALALAPEELPEETRRQIDTILETGLTGIRVGIMPDPDRLMVPVIRILGDLEKLNATLEDTTSPLRIFLVPVGDKGQYQLPTSKTDTLLFDLHREADALVFAPAGMAEADRLAALALPDRIKLRDEHVGAIQINLPEARNGDWVVDFLTQNRKLMGPDFEDDWGFQFVSKMAGGLVEELLKPLQHTDAISGGVMVMPSGHRVFDWHQQFKTLEQAGKATTFFNQEAEAGGRLQRRIALVLETSMRSTAVQDGKLMRSRFIWTEGEDPSMARALSFLGEHLFGRRSKKDMTPSAEPVPTARGFTPQLTENPDPDAFAGALPELLRQHLWVEQHWLRGDNPYVKGYLDPIHAPNTFFADVLLEPTRIVNQAGESILGPAPKFGFRKKNLYFHYPRIEPFQFHVLTEKGTPSNATLQVTCSLPATQTRIDIPAGASAGSQFGNGPYRVYLDQLDNDIVSLEVVNTVSNEIVSPRGVVALAYDKENQAIPGRGMAPGQMFPGRYHGSVHRLEVYVASPSRVSRSFEMEIDLRVPKLEKDKPSPRVRYEQMPPPMYENPDPEEIAALNVEWDNDEFRLRFPHPMQATATAPRYAFGENGEVAISGYNPHTDASGVRASIRPKKDKDGNKPPYGVAAGEIQLTYRTGMQNIEIAKTAKGATIPFTVEGKEGSVTFQDNGVRLVVPEGTEARIIRCLDAEGHPLLSEEGVAWGIPQSVIVRASTGSTTQRFPMFAETGEPYDKTAFAAFQERKTLGGQTLGTLGNAGGTLSAIPRSESFRDRARSRGEAPPPKVGYPDAEKHKTSTDFFKAQIEAGLLESGAMAGGIATELLREGDTFGPEHNGWCLITGMDRNSSHRAPFAFSRNLKLSSLAEPDWSVDPDHPLGDKVCVIHNDGQVELLKIDDPKLKELFTTASEQASGKPLGIIRP